MGGSRKFLSIVFLFLWRWFLCKFFSKKNIQHVKIKQTEDSLFFNTKLSIVLQKMQCLVGTLYYAF